MRLVVMYPTFVHLRQREVPNKAEVAPKLAGTYALIQPAVEGQLRESSGKTVPLVLPVLADASM